MTFSQAEKILKGFGYYLYQKSKTMPGQPVAYYNIQRMDRTPGILEPPTLVSSIKRINRFIENLVEAKKEGILQLKVPTEKEIVKQLRRVKINMQKFRGTFRKCFSRMTPEQRKGHLTRVKFFNDTFNTYFWPSFSSTQSSDLIDAYLLAWNYARSLENIAWEMKHITKRVT